MKRACRTAAPSTTTAVARGVSNFDTRAISEHSSRVEAREPALLLCRRLRRVRWLGSPLRTQAATRRSAHGVEGDRDMTWREGASAADPATPANDPAADLERLKERFVSLEASVQRAVSVA